MWYFKTRQCGHNLSLWIVKSMSFSISAKKKHPRVLICSVGVWLQLWRSQPLTWLNYSNHSNTLNAKNNLKYFQSAEKRKSKLENVVKCKSSSSETSCFVNSDQTPTVRCHCETGLLQISNFICHRSFHFETLKAKP